MLPPCIDLSPTHQILKSPLPPPPDGRAQLPSIFSTPVGNPAWILEPLHIEQVFIKVIDDWLENSGWTDLNGYVNINSNGCADNFLTFSEDAGIKRSHYPNQLTLASLKVIANEELNPQTCYTAFKAWNTNLEKNSPTSKYCFTVKELEKLLFAFLCSLSESMFHLFKRSFKEMLSWLTALDHIHYLRWGLEFLNNMKYLQ